MKNIKQVLVVAAISEAAIIGLIFWIGIIAFVTGSNYLFIYPLGNLGPINGVAVLVAPVITLILVLFLMTYDFITSRRPARTAKVTKATKPKSTQNILAITWPSIVGVVLLSYAFGFAKYEYQQSRQINKIQPILQQVESSAKYSIGAPLTGIVHYNYCEDDGGGDFTQVYTWCYMQIEGAANTSSSDAGQATAASIVGVVNSTLKNSGLAYAIENESSYAPKVGYDSTYTLNNLYGGNVSCDLTIQNQDNSKYTNGLTVHEGQIYFQFRCSLQSVRHFFPSASTQATQTETNINDKLAQEDQQAILDYSQSHLRVYTPSYVPSWATPKPIAADNATKTAYQWFYRGNGPSYTVSSAQSVASFDSEIPHPLGVNPSGAVIGKNSQGNDVEFWSQTTPSGTDDVYLTKFGESYILITMGDQDPGAYALLSPHIFELINSLHPAN